jgi:hypothetical protein
MISVVMLLGVLVVGTSAIPISQPFEDLPSCRSAKSALESKMKAAKLVCAEGALEDVEADNVPGASVK